MSVSLDDIHAAAQRIAGAVERTPCLHSRTLSRLTGAEVWLIVQGARRAQQAPAAGRGRAAARRDCDERWQPRAGRRPPRRAVGHARRDRDAARHAEHEGAQHAGARRGSAARRRHARPGRAARARARETRGAYLHPSLRRPCDHRGPGHRRPGNARTGAGTRRAGGAGGRRRPHFRHGGRGKGAQAGHRSIRRRIEELLRHAPAAQRPAGASRRRHHRRGPGGEGCRGIALEVNSKACKRDSAGGRRNDRERDRRAGRDRKDGRRGRGRGRTRRAARAPRPLRRQTRRHPGLRRQHRFAAAVGGGWCG